MTATPLHTKIEPCTFLDDGVFATKSGEAGIVIRLNPHDSECMEAGDTLAVARRFEAAVRLIEPGSRIYQYLIKRRRDSTKERYSYATWLVLMRPGTDIGALRASAASFILQLGEMCPAVVSGKQEAYGFLRSILNYDPALVPVPLKYDECLGYYASDSPVEVSGHGLLRVGDHYAQVWILKDPPQSTSPDFLRALREMPCECIVATEWKALEIQDVKSTIRSKTAHFHRSKYVINLWSSAASKLTKSQDERPEHMQKDESASAMESQLGALIVDVEKNGTLMGEFAMTVIVFSRDKSAVGASGSAAFKAMAGKEAILYQERHNALAAWFAALPGGHKNQIRSMYLTNHNYADFSMLFAPATGEKWNRHLNAECLAVLDTRQMNAYHANLHYEDVGHALISGMTGSGKSYLCNYLISQAVRNYGAQVVIFDVGGSYRALTSQMDGSYMEVGLKHDFTINPFCLDDTEENRHFLFSFVKVLIESGEYRMTDLDQDILFRSIPGVGRLRELVDRLPADLGRYLSRWTGDGQYAAQFDNAEDTLTRERFQTFDFEGLDKYPQIVEPLLFYVLHRANVDVYDRSKRGVFKVFLLDEAWKFLENETVRNYIYEALKTWRKHNSAMWLAMQSIEDMEKARMLRTVAENCGYLVLLPNPRMDRESYRSLFKLNERELDEVAGMTPKSESLWKPAVGESKVLRLQLEGK